MLFTVYIFHGTKTGARINLEKTRFFKLNVRSSYYDLLNVYFHVIQKLRKGVFVFDFVKFTKNDFTYHFKRNPERTFQNEQRRKTPTFGFKVSSTWHRQGVFIFIPKNPLDPADERNRLVGVAWSESASFWLKG